MPNNLPILGSYISYKNNTYIVVGIKDSLVSIMCPTDGQRKLQVSLKNIKILPYAPAKVIDHDGSSYIVTVKGNIISVKTKRLMMWPEDHGIRTILMSRIF